MDAAEDQEEYWDFTYEDFFKDHLAELEVMYNDAGGETKGIYYGYSEGTITMLAALSRQEDDYLQYLMKVVLLAPCAIPQALRTLPGMLDDSLSEPEWYFRETLGVQALSGPTYTEDLERICELASEELCANYQLFAGVSPIPQK